MSLVARALETAGIATVVLGSARDIVEHCGVPRFLFVDYPLGNPCGKPWDVDNQAAILQQALALYADASAPGQTVVAPFTWDDSAAWKQNYMHVGPDNIDALRAAGERRRAEQVALRQQSGRSA